MRRLGVLAFVLCMVAACGGGSTATISPTAQVQCTPQPVASASQSVAFPRGSGLNEPVLFVEVADTPEERSVGLMNRACLSADAGMVFEFPEDTSAAFWMKDTLIPLSIAFVKADGTIVHIEDMQPQTETNHYSTAPYRYAIEANQGWFAAQGISAGDKAEVPSGISATS